MTDTDDEAKQDEPRASRPWLDDIAGAEKAFDEYQRKCDSIEKQYANLSAMSDTVGDRQFQIFWANMEVIRPTIYQRAPMPVVASRNSDSTPLHKKAAELLERVLTVDVEMDDLHDTLQLVRDDLAICGRGIPWVLDNGQCIHVSRQDFVHDPVRKWSEVGWVARRAYLTRDEGVERFGPAFHDAKFEQVEQRDESEYKTTRKKAPVWEVWSRTENVVVWVTEGVEDVLDVSEPLVDVKGFFPCPKPVYATLERSTLKPVPDFVYYRDQVDEINELTARISSLSESLRLKGFYASGTSEVGEAIEAAMQQTDNKAILVPVSNFAALGGQKLSDSIVWLPVDQVANVIVSCVELRKQLIQDVYEITGLSDIMRGQTAASETATAQNLKSQYGSVRVRERQNEMVRVARDILRIKAEIFAEQYSAQELALMAQMQIPSPADMMAMQQGQQQEPPVTLEQVDQLLKMERLRPFVLEVETDSTIAPNEQEEKQSRMEFIQAVGSFIQQASPMVAQQPETAPFAAELLKFTAGAFRAGRELDGAINDFAEQIKAKAAQGQEQQGPTPEQIEAQTEAQKVQAELQNATQKLQGELAKLQAEIDKTRAETEHTNAKTQQILMEMSRPEPAESGGYV